jgi:hypothetical protein
MKFKAHEDIGLDARAVFAALTDFPAMEREALQRGAEVERLGEPDETGVGQSWRIKFRYRKRRRVLEAEVLRLDPPRGLTSRGKVGGVNWLLTIDLIALAAKETRMSVELELMPKSISARILLQSLRLAKATLDQRFRRRIRDFARALEAGRRR